MGRYQRFLQWLGIPLHLTKDFKPAPLSKIISEFALEYRTARERVVQQKEKKRLYRQRNRTRGRMITDGDVDLTVPNGMRRRTSTKNTSRDQHEDEKLKKLLSTNSTPTKLRVPNGRQIRAAKEAAAASKDAELFNSLLATTSKPLANGTSSGNGPVSAEQKARSKRRIMRKATGDLTSKAKAASEDRSRSIRGGLTEDQKKALGFFR